MIQFLELLLIAATAAAAAGLLAAVELGLLFYRSVQGLGANLTDGETPAQEIGSCRPVVNPARAASAVPHRGGPGTAFAPQVHSDPPALEVRRASGASLVATIERAWDHHQGGPVMVVRPEPTSAPRSV